MAVIRNYTNTLIDLRTSEARYSALRERREVYYVKYLGIKSPSYEKVGGGRNWAVDGMTIFLDLVTKKNKKTGMSLDDEIEKLAQEIAFLSKLVKEMGVNLKRMKGIEYQLYSTIVIDGIPTTKAVKKVAEDNFLSEEAVWHTYLPRIREELRKLEI